MKEVIVVMGISGAGKSTVGKALANRMGMPFLDADDFHPRENVMKMSSGQPLDDDDRWPWLAAIVEHILQSHRPCFVLGCSALKESYRLYLAQRLKLHLVYLEITAEEAHRRLKMRKRHFMPATLVQSQLDALEIPSSAFRLSATLNITKSVDLLAEHFSTLQ
ncbi:gluconokinase [Roseivirga thermotolerans]|uniref:gluconokinase n=1 Tax=Roseivirga thermotolerans TaxID=1758176 RepID=UPI00273DB3B6|nr:gluconokinase [Roseivirga thermotolerans]